MPDDLVLVASTPVHDAVVDYVIAARESEPALRAITDLADRARRIVAFLSPGMFGDIGGALERNESLSDHLVRIAAVSSAPLVTDDPYLAPTDQAIWRHIDGSGRPAFAVTFWNFVDRTIDQATAGLDDVPFDLLVQAMRDDQVSS